MPRKGLVVDEPNVVLQSATNPQPLFFGEQALARKMRKSQRRVWPFEQGVIAKFDPQAAIIKHWLQQQAPKYQLVKPDVVVVVNGVATESQKRALLESVPSSLVRKVYPLRADYAAALGAGLSIEQPKGCLVIHCGAGSTDISLFSLGQAVHHKSLRIGGQDFTRSLQVAVSRYQVLEVDEQDLEIIKTNQLSLLKPKDRLRIQGTDDKGRQKKVTVSAESCIAALEPALDRIVNATKQIFEAASPTLVGDIAENGILLTGGSAQLKGLSTYLSRRLHANCVTAVEPSLCAIRGVNFGTTFLRDFQRQTH